MKKFSMFLAAGLLAVPMMALAEVKVAVVDLRQALFTSNAAQAFSNKLRDEFKSQEAAARKAGEEAQKLKDKLEKDGAMMNDAERTKMASQFEERAKEFNYLKNKLDSSIATRKQDFLKEERPKLDKALDELVKEMKLDIILPKETVVFAQPQYDITTKLQEKLNR